MLRLVTEKLYFYTKQRNEIINRKILNDIKYIQCHNQEICRQEAIIYRISYNREKKKLKKKINFIKWLLAKEI